jgi:uncharacterized protein YlxW (UPF0749 family)
MTIDERLARIEHVTAGSDEQRRKDRETDRALWRDTQRQLNDLTIKVADLGDRIAALEETDRRLGARIETMISAMGQFIASQPNPQAS